MNAISFILFSVVFNFAFFHPLHAMEEEQVIVDKGPAVEAAAEAIKEALSKKMSNSKIAQIIRQHVQSLAGDMEEEANHEIATLLMELAKKIRAQSMKRSPVGVAVKWLTDAKSRHVQIVAVLLSTAYKIDENIGRTIQANHELITYVADGLKINLKQFRQSFQIPENVSDKEFTDEFAESLAREIKDKLRENSEWPVLLTADKKEIQFDDDVMNKCEWSEQYPRLLFSYFKNTHKILENPDDKRLINWCEATSDFYKKRVSKYIKQGKPQKGFSELNSFCQKQITSACDSLQEAEVSKLNFKMKKGLGGSFRIKKGMKNLYIPSQEFPQSYIDLNKFFNLKSIHKEFKGNNIGIAIFEQGVDPKHEEIKQCTVASEIDQKCFKAEHGTGVASIAKIIAPSGNLHLIHQLGLFIGGRDYFEDPSSALLLEDNPHNIRIINWSGGISLGNKMNRLEKQEIEKKAHFHMEKSKLPSHWDSIKGPFYTGYDVVLGHEYFFQTPEEIERMKKVMRQKIILVKAAGNFSKEIGQDLLSFAKNESNGQMIVVGSLDVSSDGTESLANHSNYVSDPEAPFICAPGSDILTASIGKNGESTHFVTEGTSLAAPIVSGALALLMEAFPQWKDTPDKYVRIILDSARKTTKDGKDITKKCGAGILDINNALKVGRNRQIKE